MNGTFVVQLTEMELRHLAMVRAAEAERQLLQQHHHRPSPAAVTAFYPSTIVPAGGQGHAAARLPLAALPDRLAPALLPTQSAAGPVYRPVASVPPDFHTPTAPVRLKSRDDPSPDDVGGRILLPEAKTRPTSTGSGSTTPAKRHVNSFSIDSLLGRPQDDRTLSSVTLEVRKSVADQPVVDAASRQRPDVSPTCSPVAPVPRIVPGCTARPLLVTWF